jgi:AraC family transcriptional regulator
MALTPESFRQGGEALLRLGNQPARTLTNVFRARYSFRTYFGQIFSLELNKPAHLVQDFLIESLGVALSAHLLREYTPGAKLSERRLGGRRCAVHSVIDYINAFRHDQITLSELASASGLSRFHLIRVFKAETGVSPMQYLERSRIEYAQALIREAELSLVQIALARGFADQSHFTRRFKFHTGFTPAQYAREFGRRRLPS